MPNCCESVVGIVLVAPPPPPPPPAAVGVVLVPSSFSFPLLLLFAGESAEYSLVSESDYTKIFKSLTQCRGV